MMCNTCICLCAFFLIENKIAKHNTKRNVDASMVAKICFTHSIYIQQPYTLVYDGISEYMYQIEIMQKNEDLFIEMSAMQRMKLNI